MKTDKSLSSMAGICAFLVVLGHSMPFPGTFEEVGSFATYLNVISWLRTLRMPMFFFMAGYSYVRFSAAKRTTLAQFAKQKAMRLLIPYAVLSTCAFPIKALLSRYAIHPASLRWADYCQQLVLPWYNCIKYFWYLPTLFVMFLLIRLILSKNDSRIKIVVVAILAVAGFFFFHHQNYTGWEAVLNLGGCLHNFVFVWLGAMTARFGWERTVTSKGLPLLLISLMLFIFLPKDLVPRNELGISNPIGLILSVCNVLGLWSLMHRYYLRVFDVLGNYSFPIYLLSWFPQILVRIFGSVSHLRPGYTSALMCLAGTVIPILVAKWFAKAKPRLVRFTIGLPARPAAILREQLA